MRSGLEGSRVVEALDRFSVAHPRTFWALLAAVQIGMIEALPFHDPWEGMVVPGRVAVFGVAALVILPRYAVVMVRAWDGPNRRMWIGGLAAHLTWFGLAMGGGPHVRPFIVFLAIAAAMYIEETIRRRVATDRSGAADGDRGV